MLGSQGFRDAGIPTYGTNNKSIDAGVMPGWQTLPADELIAVVRHERETLSGEEGDFEEDAEGNRLWPNGEPMLDASGTLIWDDGEPMFDDEGKLTKDIDASQPPAGG